MRHSSHVPNADNQDDAILYRAQLVAEDEEAERMYQRWCADNDAEERSCAPRATEDADAARDADVPAIAVEHDVF